MLGDIRLYLIVDDVYWVVIISKENWAFLLIFVVILVVYRVVNMFVVVSFLLLAVYSAVNMFVVVLFFVLIRHLILFVVKVFVLFLVGLDQLVLWREAPPQREVQLC